MRLLLRGIGLVLLLVASLAAGSKIGGQRWVWPKRVQRQSKSVSASLIPVGDRRDSNKGFDNLFKQRSGKTATAPVKVASFRSFSDFLGYVNGVGAAAGVAKKAKEAEQNKADELVRNGKILNSDLTPHF